MTSGSRSGYGLINTPSCSVCTECFSKDAIQGFGDLNQAGKAIRSVKYAEHLVLLAEEEAVLQVVCESVPEIGRCFGVEMNVEKSEVMRIIRQQSPA